MAHLAKITFVPGLERGELIKGKLRELAPPTAWFKGPVGKKL